MMAESISYWTERRKIRKRVTQHLEAIAKKKRQSDVLSSSSDENDETRVEIEGVELQHIGERAQNVAEETESDLPYQESKLDSPVYEDPLSHSVLDFEVDTLSTRFLDSHNTSSDDNCNDSRDDSLSSKLASWAVTFQVPQTAVSSLLDI